MKNIFTIARKEFLDTIRDRRTVLMMVIIPLLLFPVIMLSVAAFTASRAKKAQTKQLRVGWISESHGLALKALLEEDESIRLISGVSAEEAPGLIRKDSLDLAIDLGENFDRSITPIAHEQGKVILYHQSTDEEQIIRRIRVALKSYENGLLADRLTQLELDSKSIDPLDIDEKDIATKQEVVGKMAGGFLPYMFVLFCFMGCMYPAIDLFTGEKERGTLETILTAPVNRLHILFGKMAVVVVSGLSSALLGILGLVMSISLVPDIPQEFLAIIQDMLQAKTIILLLAMLIPLAIFFAGVLIPVSSYAKSFKEAQSLIGPMNILVIIPAAIGLMPGFELSWGTALVPILNVALSTKDIVADTINYGLLALVFVSLVAFAVAAVAASVYGFSRESNIVRA